MNAVPVEFLERCHRALEIRSGFHFLAAPFHQIHSEFEDFETSLRVTLHLNPVTKEMKFIQNWRVGPYPSSLPVVPDDVRPETRDLWILSQYRKYLNRFTLHIVTYEVESPGMKRCDWRNQELATLLHISRFFPNVTLRDERCYDVASEDLAEWLQASKIFFNDQIYFTTLYSQKQLDFLFHQMSFQSTRFIDLPESVTDDPRFEELMLKFLESTHLDRVFFSVMTSYERKFERLLNLWTSCKARSGNSKRVGFLGRFNPKLIPNTRMLEFITPEGGTTAVLVPNENTARRVKWTYGSGGIWRDFAFYVDLETN